MQKLECALYLGKALDFLLVDRGCSQGTVGGPRVLSMYTDDVRAENPSSQLSKYSDDMSCLSLCLKDPSEKEAKEFQCETENLLTWAKRKDLCTNITKSKPCDAVSTIRINE